MIDHHPSEMQTQRSHHPACSLLACLVIGMTASIPAADEIPEDPVVVIADFDGDGRRESISTAPAGPETDAGTFFRLVVKDADGTVIWTSPRTQDTGHPLAFGSWHFGVSLPQMAADLDGDGRPELIVPAPQSDVSPTVFRVFRWTGQGFEPQSSRSLSGRGRKNAAFKWTDDPPVSDYWVQQWLGISAEGGFVVELASLPEGAELRVATAVLARKGSSFELVRWIQTPSRLGEPVAEHASPPAGDTYRARLSARDHLNSSGEILKKVIDILRQDRANVHRATHRDAEDQADNRFDSAQAREALGRMPVTVVGGASAVSRILNGTPVVQVQTANGGLRVEIVGD